MTECENEVFKRRAATACGLARVLALEPEILLLDEPLVILIILERMPAQKFVCLLEI
jgi:ABC-type taurine transport system ATPase subunit